MLVDRAERVEIPVVVIPERPRLVAEARRSFASRTRRGSTRRNAPQAARARSPSSLPRSARGRCRRCRDCRASPRADLVPLDSDTDQRSTGLRTEASSPRVALLRNDQRVLDDHHRRRTDPFRPRLGLGEYVGGPTGLVCSHVVPRDAGEMLLGPIEVVNSGTAGRSRRLTGCGKTGDIGQSIE